MAIIIETCPKCGHDLQSIVICTYPPIPRKECPNCGWSWEGKREEVIRVPFDYNSDFDLVDLLNNATFEQSTCINCPNNPKNGGSGNCNCTLGLPKIT